MARPPLTLKELHDELASLLALRPELADTHCVFSPILTSSDNSDRLYPIRTLELSSRTPPGVSYFCCNGSLLLRP